jgi:hypothetical protein
MCICAFDLKNKKTYGSNSSWLYSFRVFFYIFILTWRGTFSAFKYTISITQSFISLMAVISLTKICFTRSNKQSVFYCLFHVYTFPLAQKAIHHNCLLTKGVKLPPNVQVDWYFIVVVHLTFTILIFFSSLNLR